MSRRQQSLLGALALALLSSVPNCNRADSALTDRGEAQGPSSAASRSPGSAEETSRPVVGGGRVDIAGAYNVRSVGPLMARGNRRIKPLQLMRSGHLALVTEEGYARMVELGIASVVDLRSVSEGKATPDAPWVKRGTRHLTLDLPEVVPSDVNTSAHMLDTLEAKLPALFTHLVSPGALPVLIHCGTGKGRACVGMAVILLALGVSPSDVATDFAHNQDADVDPHGLDGLFARVAAAGGIDEYLQKHSVSPSAVERLRAQALGVPEPPPR